MVPRLGSLGLLACLLGVAVLWPSTFVSAALRINSFMVNNDNSVKALHGTAAYRTNTFLVVRRGLDLNMRISLDSELNPEQSFTIQTAPFSIFDASTFRLNHVGGGLYDVTATIDVNAPVGATSVAIRLSDRQQVSSLNRQLAVIFNAWHPMDLAHYPDPQQLNEYINNEHGITFRGSTRQIQNVRWFYGQFNQEATQVAMYIINKLPQADRRDPGKVARIVTAMVTQQTQHPDGILVGSWAQSFPNGANPSSWQGSDSILRQYVNQRFTPVRYGQCWVFGALVQTLMRNLGVATRQVSNFDSAHETPEVPEVFNQEIARFWDRNSRRMTNERGMIWNFHSWNEVYVHQPSSPSPYNLPGWHTVDGTPQEHSSGKFQLGPASVKAVKEGRKIPHDTSFVMSEVSARIHNYLVGCSAGGCGIVQDMGYDPGWPTGTILTTKAIGGFAQETITATYHNRVLSGPVRHSNFGARTASVGSGSATSTITGAPADKADAEETERGIEAARAAAAVRADAATAAPDVATATDDAVREEVAVYHYTESGVSMAINIPAVRLGEPLVAFVNFACKSHTEDFDASLRARDRATRHVTLAGDEAPEPVTAARANSTEGLPRCPEEVDVSFRLVLAFSNYNGAELDVIGDVNARVKLHAENGHFKSFRFVSSDYWTKLQQWPVTNYVRATVMATDHSSGAAQRRDVLFFGSQSMQFVEPKVELYANRSSIFTTHAASRHPPAAAPGELTEADLDRIARGDDDNDMVEAEISDEGIVSRPRRAASDAGVRVSIRFVNPLPIELTEAEVTLSADHLGFDEKTIRINNIPPRSTFLYVHEFSSETAETGRHFYHAVLNTRELQPVVGEIAFDVNAHLLPPGHASSY